MFEPFSSLLYKVYKVTNHETSKCKHSVCAVSVFMLNNFPENTPPLSCCTNGHKRPVAVLSSRSEEQLYAVVITSALCELEEAETIFLLLSR